MIDLDLAKDQEEVKEPYSPFNKNDHKLRIGSARKNKEVREARGTTQKNIVDVPSLRSKKGSKLGKQKPNPIN